MRKTNEGILDFPCAGVGFSHFDRNTTFERWIGKAQIFAGEFRIAKCSIRCFGNAQQPSDSVRLRCFEGLSFCQSAVKGARRNDAENLLGIQHTAIDEVFHPSRIDAVDDLLVNKGPIFFRKSGWREFTS